MAEEHKVKRAPLVSPGYLASLDPPALLGLSELTGPLVKQESRVLLGFKGRTGRLGTRESADLKAKRAKQERRETLEKTVLRVPMDLQDLLVSQVSGASWARQEAEERMECQDCQDPLVHQGNQELLEFRAAPDLLVESVCQEPPDPVEKPALRVSPVPRDLRVQMVSLEQGVTEVMQVQRVSLVVQVLQETRVQWG